MLTTWILAWLHVISAMSWLGGGILFAFVVGPAVAKLSPPTRGEFVVKVVPLLSRFFQAVAGLTTLFGILLLVNLGGFGLLNLSTFYGVDLTVGVALALAAFASTEFVTVPFMRMAIRTLVDARAAGQTEPPAEFPRLLRRASLFSIVSVVLLIFTSVLMVGAGFY